MTIYQYGPIAWFWRVLCLAAILAAGFLVTLSLRLDTWLFGVIALIVGTPAIVLPWMVATHIERVGEDEIDVTNLFFKHRRIGVAALGRPRFKQTAQGAITHIDAPRAWVPVAGGWPIYLDLNGHIPDSDAFSAVFPTLRGKVSTHSRP